MHFLHHLYEDNKLYRANPCDADGHPVVKVLAPGFEYLATHCQCCSGARIAAVAVLAAVMPGITIAGICLAFVWGVIRAIK